jgi:hypothetical protein
MRSMTILVFLHLFQHSFDYHKKTHYSVAWFLQACTIVVLLASHYDFMVKSCLHQFWHTTAIFVSPKVE